MEPIRPSVWRRARRNTARSVSAVRIASGEYQGCPPRVVRGSACQAAIASSVNQTVRLPRWRRAASYSAQLVTRCRCLGMRWRRAALALNGTAEVRGSWEGPPHYAIRPPMPTGPIRAPRCVAPIGAFGAMAFTVGKYGVATLLSLGQLMGSVYITCLIFIFGVLGIVCAMSGFSVLKLIRYIREELLIVLGTSSSESVLPRMLAKMENLGCDKSVVGLVIPSGYSFNLDGTCIYLTMAAVFLAQATNTPLDIGHQLGLIAVLLLTSKGAAGVTGSGFIVLAATLASVGTVPVASIAIILGVDRFMSEARALTNLIGNAVATVVVARWEGAVDMARLHRHLNRETDVEADDHEAVLVAEEEARGLGVPAAAPARLAT